MFEAQNNLISIFEQSSFLLVIISGLLVTCSSVVYYYKYMYSIRLKEVEKRSRDEKERLQDQLRNLTQVMDNLGEPCIYKNSKSVYSWCNKELELLWGIPRSRIIGFTVEDLFPEQTDDIRKLEAQVLGSGHTLVKERTLSDKNGETRSFEVTLKLIPESDGSGILIFFKDITHYRDQLNILSDLYVSTREDLQKRSDYYADFLRSGLPPLNKIMKDSELLLNETGDQKTMRGRVVEIADSCHQIDSYIRNLSFLAFPDKTAALYEKKNENSREVCALEDWQNKLVNRISSFSEKTGWSSFVLLQGDVPEALNTRFVLLNELLERLIENAEKYSRGGFYLLIKVHRVESGYFTMNISVRNYGPVIDASQREAIFKPFTRIIKKGDDSGLGLTVGRSLAEKMGGSLSCDPACKDGARFLLSLPPVEGEGTVISGNRLDGHAGTGIRTFILVHLENPVLIRLSVQLKRVGYDVFVLQSIESCEQLLNTKEHVFIIVDDAGTNDNDTILHKKHREGLFPSLLKIINLSSVSTPSQPLEWSLLLDLLTAP